MEAKNSSRVYLKVKKSEQKNGIEESVFVKGPPTKTQKNKQYYRSLQVRSDEVRAGDVVELVALKGDPYLALVEEIWKNEKGIFIKGRWFYRQNDTHLGQLPMFHPNEVFLSNVCDENSVESITTKCTFEFITEDRTERRGASPGCPSYLCRYFYLAEHLVFRPLSLGNWSVYDNFQMDSTELPSPILSSRNFSRKKSF